ncbi:cytochrome c biogenesis protein CcdA [Streptomyces sp. TRM70308]|uniref:cytochrome c biogenesis CcdA family protein n=1 Tax=Streptomyces TaxID=1883 RepID=UPI002248EB51|nr:cytochrome c biogenesis protein CcdA [Streptomyces sp. JHD 1]MCX2968905.1 sulfite exporter TauE/SafE family protein [Streptomyces sp. JHD 1]
MNLLAAVTDTNDTVLSGALLLALPIALLAGLVSFFSPCVLPLVPGYLSYVTGVGGSDLAEARRGRMVGGALLFVLGFTAVFVSTGAAFGYVGDHLLMYQETITRVLGVFVIVLGLSFMGALPWLRQREFRIHRKPTVGLLGAPVLGLLFGLGWTPCIGPTLAAVNALAYNEASAGRGALLMVVFCLGLGLPFVVAALAFRRALGAFGWVKRHYAWVMRVGGGLLVAVGVLLVTGIWNEIVYKLQVWSADFTVGI